MKSFQKSILPFLFSILFSHLSLFGTHGTEFASQSIKGMGMGGVAAAYPQDTLISSVNPAGMYWVPNELDIGLTIFRPIRKYSYTGVGFPGDSVKSGRDYYFVPNLGYSQKVGCAVFGFSVYGEGIGTDYPRNNPIFGQRRLGVDFLEAIFAPTVSIPLLPSCLKCHSVGIAPLIGVHTIKVAGLQNFAPFSSDPAYLTNKKYSWACGMGVRFGWMGKLVPCFFNMGSIWGGAAYATKIYMTRFQKYAGLFVDHGSFDVPANYTLGLRWETPLCMNICFDFRRILYSGVPSYHNSINALFEGNLLGSKNGPAFGWNDISIYKIGVDYALSRRWKVRAGGSFGNAPFDEVDFNILAPSVIKAHFSLGATWIYRCHEFDIAYVHAFKNAVEGQSRVGLGDVRVEMFQDQVSFNYHLNF